MTDSRTHQYGKYAIVVRIWPAPGNMYQSSFTIHEPAPGPGTQPMAIVHEQGRHSGFTCATADDADLDAMERASTWVDAQLS